MTGRKRPFLGMILKGFPRISETFISNEILLLESLGIPIHLFSMRQPRETFSHDSVKAIRAEVDYLPETLLQPLPRFLYHNLRLARKVPHRYVEALKTAVRRYRRSRNPATLKHLFQAGYLVDRLLPGQNIVHFHAHFAHSPASVAMFAGGLSGRPFSLTAHAKDIYTSDPEQLIEKLSRARFAVTCTGYNRRYLEALSNSVTTPIYRIYHGIDLNLFIGGKDNLHPAPPFQILTVARLTRKKGLPTVLKALRRLVDQGVALRYTLIGDGEDRKRILSLVRQLKLDDVTRWLGTQPHHVVLDHYRRADLFVLGCEIAPNGDRDGIPNVILESMAMGVPVVATRVSAIPEVIEDQQTGLLADPGRPDALARCMLRMLTDGSLRHRVIPRAKAQVSRNFDNGALIRELAVVYREKIPEFRSPA